MNEHIGLADEAEGAKGQKVRGAGASADEKNAAELAGAEGKTWGTGSGFERGRAL
jgi:hypothetical protein